MYVCLCKAVTDRQIRDLANGGACYAEVRKELGVATQCGKCGQQAKTIVQTTVRKTAAEPAL